MTERHLKRLLREAEALAELFPWIDHLMRAAVRGRYPGNRSCTIAVRHCDGRRETCQPPHVDKVPWKPADLAGKPWVQVERCK